MSRCFRRILWLITLYFLCYGLAYSNENTFHNQSSDCGLGIPVPEDNCTVGLSFPIEVSGYDNSLGSNVELSEIRLIIDHVWELDLRIYLVSPLGRRVPLSVENSTSATTFSYGDPDAPNCSSFTAFTMDPCKATIRIDDEFIENNFVGTFLPEGDFADFNGEDPNGTWFLEICDDDSDANAGTLEYAEMFFNDIHCGEPTGVTITEIFPTGFNMIWNQATPGAHTVIEIVPEGVAPGNGFISPTGGQIENSFKGAFNLLGLDEATRYDIYIRELCSNGNFSKNTCATTIQTACHVSAPTIYENFDNQQMCQGACGEVCNLFGFWSNHGNDDFDWLVFEGATQSARTGPTSDASGNGRYLYIESTGFDCRFSSTAVLESNCTFVTANDNSCHLSFEYHMYGFGIGELKLQVQAQGSSTWDDLWSEVGDQGDQWNKQYIDLSNYANSFARFRFIASNANSTTGDIALDEITFYGPFDNGTPSTSYYEDLDQDGFGDPGIAIQSCSFTAPQGYVNNNLDCNDSNPLIFPGSQEITCNGEDDNCNGMDDDDEVIMPVVFNQNICSNKSTPVNTNSTPIGELYWYSDAQGQNLLGIGDELSTELNPGTHTLYVKDSIVYGPGLKITEIELNENSRIELQSIGVSGDYTGWKVIVNSLVAGQDINDVVLSEWELSYMKRDQVVTRSRSEWTPAVFWSPGLTGWAMLLDPDGEAMDIVFWNWSDEDLMNFNLDYEGINYNIHNVPWWGSSIDVSECDEEAIILTGETERNFIEDYVCGVSSIGNSNQGLNMTTHCGSALAPFNVSVFQAPIVTIDLDVDPCEEFSITSAIDLEIVSGIGPYSFLWSNGSTLEDQTNLSPGNYSVTVTSINGCQTIIEEISIGQNSSTFGIELQAKEDVSCHGFDDGKAIVKVVGGPPPYQFNWSVGIERDLISDTDTLDFLPRGNYEVTVTDNNGCTSSMLFDIQEPPEISIDLEIEQPSCQNTEDGAIYVNSAGGTDPLEFFWFDNSKSTEVTNLNPGEYSVTIEDANGCLVVLDQIILQTEQDTIAVENVTIEHVVCNGANTGEIVVDVLGGDKPLSFLWSNGGETNTQHEIGAGTYGLTITDEVGCSISLEDITIFEPTTPITYGFNTISTACLGNCNGVAVAEAEGGIPPYTFSWENGETNSTIENLCNGFIGLTIEDFAGCQQVIENEIFIDSQPTDFILDLEIEEVRCHGEASGAIDLDVTGGVEPYQFDWDIAPDVQNPQGLIAGVYNCTVVDAEGCEFHLEDVNIDSPDPIEIMLVESIGSGTNQFEGSLEVEVEGGTDPYTINWYNELGGWIEQGSKIENLNPGIYRIQMLDFNSCAAALDSLVVPLLTSSSNISDNSTISLYPNPVQQSLNYRLSIPATPSNLEIQIVDILGRQITTQKVAPQFNGQVDTQDLTAGYYIFNVRLDGQLIISESFVKGE